MSGEEDRGLQRDPKAEKAEGLMAVGLCLEERYILLEDGRHLEIIQMMDAGGHETDCIHCCVGIIFRRPDGRFGVEHVSRFTEDMRIGRKNS